MLVLAVAAGIAGHLLPAVKLTSVPNVPIAEAICTRLRANGIEAFYKRPQLAQFITDFGPAEIWVGEHQLEEARTLLGSQAG